MKEYSQTPIKFGEIVRSPSILPKLNFDIYPEIEVANKERATDIMNSYLESIGLVFSKKG